MKEQFEKAWEACISEYRKGCVNSECTLQALMYSELRNSLPGHYVVFCEPRIVRSDLNAVYPDIVVISSNEIVAVVELKFAPHHFPKFRTDIAKMASLAREVKAQNILLDIKTGKFQDKVHSFAKPCFFVYAAIGNKQSGAVCADTLTECFRNEEGVGESRFLPLTLAVPEDE